MRTGSCDGDELVGGLAVGAADGGWRGKGARDRGDAEERLALFAVGRLGNQVRAARFVIQQNRLDDGLEVAPDAGAVIVENLGDAINIIPARDCW